MQDHLAIGLVGIAYHTRAGRHFLMHDILGVCLRPEHRKPPLAFSEDGDVIICAVPVWSTILNLAVRAGMTLEITPPPDHQPSMAHIRRKPRPKPEGDS